MLNEFSRTEILIGKEAAEKLAGSYVAVFGVGGVGSFVTEGLVRAGVGKFMLVDDDYVCITNINRQLHATVQSVGQPKVEVMRDRIQTINPQAEVRTSQTFYLPDNATELISPEYDYLVDAIDTVSAKIDLIVRAQEQGIPVISCMGAGNKLDPAKLTVADIYATSVCPLARVVRRELRKRGIKSLKVVYSPEESVKPAESTESGCRFRHLCPKGDGNDCGTKRRQVPGSISFVPSVAGLLIAGEVVRDIISPNV
ncbi:MAG: tRNA threonylcarbamoyladenosine dehydratase [Peptococcaceae bacterium]|nr:tRNA threonylcarbamoyladenosine dehydratase [Peptococcaceae bacterium]